MSCGVGLRLGSDPTLLWVWCRLATAALIQPLAWEPPHASGATLKKQKNKEEEEEEEGWISGISTPIGSQMVRSSVGEGN